MIYCPIFILNNVKNWAQYKDTQGVWDTDLHSELTEVKLHKASGYKKKACLVNEIFRNSRILIQFCMPGPDGNLSHIVILLIFLQH